MYRPHPKYDKRGVIPAYEMIKFSVNIHRGCFGGCSFCAIAAHQGKQVISRSETSVLKEVEKITSEFPILRVIFRSWWSLGKYVQDERQGYDLDASYVQGHPVSGLQYVIICIPAIRVLPNFTGKLMD